MQHIVPNLTSQHLLLMHAKCFHASLTICTCYVTSAHLASHSDFNWAYLWKPRRSFDDRRSRCNVRTKPGKSGNDADLIDEYKAVWSLNISPGVPFRLGQHMIFICKHLDEIREVVIGVVTLQSQWMFIKDSNLRCGQTQIW
jgi:hypothetical protein